MERVDEREKDLGLAPAEDLSRAGARLALLARRAQGLALHLVGLPVRSLVLLAAVCVVRQASERVIEASVMLGSSGGEGGNVTILLTRHGLASTAARQLLRVSLDALAAGKGAGQQRPFAAILLPLRL